MKLKSIVMLLSLVTTMMAINAAGGSGVAFATTNATTDPMHCEKPGFPACFSVGYKEGHNARSGAACPSGHSPNYCAGWNTGSGNTAHCDKPGWPSCYDLGYQAGKNALSGAACPSGHSPNYCAGWNTGSGNTAHCDKPGWPSCYDLGYQAGKNAL